MARRRNIEEKKGLESSMVGNKEMINFVSKMWYTFYGI